VPDGDAVSTDSPPRFLSVLHDLHRPVVVAVVAAWVVEVAADEVVDVISVRYCLVPAVRTVLMVAYVVLAVMVGRGSLRVLVAHGDRVLLDRPVVRVLVQLPVMHVQRAPVEPYRGVPAARSVPVVVIVHRASFR
jgi:hypothetical protein